MKKYIAILALSVFCACTVRKENTCERSGENLAAMAGNICSIVGDDVVVTLSKIVRDSAELLFQQGMDTTLESHSYHNSIRVKCVSPADSILSVEPGKDGGMAYAINIRIRGRDADGQPLWTWAGEGTYTEDERFSSLFRSGADSLKFAWTKYYYMYDYGTVDSMYVAVKTGEWFVSNYSGNDKLDEVKLIYKGKDGSSYTILR